MASGPNLILDPSEYECPICRCIITTAVSSSCGHIFCVTCLQSFLSSQTSCPVCRSRITLSQCYFRKDIDNKIHETDTQCTSCRTRVKLKLFEQHLDNCIILKKQLVSTKKGLISKAGLAVPNRVTFSCPYCSQPNFTNTGLMEHVNSLHQSDPRKVVCPICVSQPWGDPTQKSQNFHQHLVTRHNIDYNELVNYDLSEDDMLRKAIEASRNEY